VTTHIDSDGLPEIAPEHHPGPLGALESAVEFVHKAVIAFGSLALLLASGVLTYSVFSRYLFHAATDWQDEVAVFSIVGAVFLAGAWVQDHRGHVGIEALSSVLPPGVERIRIVVVDLMTFAFCAFFAWKSWTLFHEAWVDKMTTSSTFAPPLAIPYGLMSVGMTLLVAQVALQIAGHFAPGMRRGRRRS
jgi:TRAP-type C4-dicarboxylate transport system permease small subunit